MKIKKIKLTKPNLYEVLIDNNKHLLFDDTLLKFGIFKPGDYLLKLNDILDYNDVINGYNIAIKYISHHLRTEKEIRQKLAQKNIGNYNINQIINRLKEEKYLDEDKYIKAFINDQIKLTLHGPNHISKLLSKVGFKNQNAYLDSISKDEWNSRVIKIINKKLKISKGSKQMVIMKLKSDLITLGYNDSYFYLVDGINYDESISYKKDYDKYYKKYSQKNVSNAEELVKQKLYSLGYRQ